MCRLELVWMIGKPLRRSDAWSQSHLVPVAFEDMLHFINLINWYIFYTHIFIQENWQGHRSGKSLLLQIIDLSCRLSPPGSKKSRIIWCDKREPNPHLILCASIIPFIFAQTCAGTEQNKEWASYIIHDLWHIDSAFAANLAAWGHGNVW